MLTLQQWLYWSNLQWHIKSSLSQASIQRLIRAAEQCRTSTTMQLQGTKSLNDGFLKKSQAMKNHGSVRLEKTVFISCRLLWDYIAILIILLTKKRFTIIILVIKKKPDTVYTFIMVILIHQQIMDPFRWFRRKMWFCFMKQLYSVLDSTTAISVQLFLSWLIKQH